MEKKLAVVAVGGNSLITDKAHVTVDDQYKAAAETCKHFIELMDAGYKLVITHGNGPQVGMINLAFTESNSTPTMPEQRPTYSPLAPSQADKLMANAN